MLIHWKQPDMTTWCAQGRTRIGGVLRLHFRLGATGAADSGSFSPAWEGFIAAFVDDPKGNSRPTILTSSGMANPSRCSSSGTSNTIAACTVVLIHEPCIYYQQIFPRNRMQRICTNNHRSAPPGVRLRKGRTSLDTRPCQLMDVSRLMVADGG